VRSCETTVDEVKGEKIITIEGLPENHPVKIAWIQEQVVQCGYCQPGIIMQTASLLAESPNPQAEKIIDGLDDVICRCGTYARVKKGVETAIQIMGKEGK
jgi:isoquinoline 1-oxidoreductase alpha subunit